jgi:hypothetical protein
MVGLSFWQLKIKMIAKEIKARNIKSFFMRLRFGDVKVKTIFGFYATIKK